MYTVEDLIKDLNDFLLNAEVRPLECKEDIEDETYLFQIHCKEPIELEVNANHWKNKGEIREAKVWIIATE